MTANASLSLLPAVLALLGSATLSAQVRWEAKTSSSAPSDRWNSAMAFDAARGRSVLFGGDPLQSPTAQDTWEWDGTRWTERRPANSPPALGGHAMAFDALRQRVVLFGGTLGPQNFHSDDTWEWDGSDWTLRATAQRPTPRTEHAMAFDRARGVVVLFGGFDGLRYYDDTWEWNGQDWRRVPTSTVPRERAGHAMAYDAAAGHVVLFGGARVPDLLNDTWTYDGVDWTPLTPGTQPTPRSQHTMVHDALRHRIVVAGGEGVASITDAWEWDGADWQQRSPANPPGARFAHAAAYDNARQQMLLFGGIQPGGTWTYGTDSPASGTNFGSGCGGVTGVPTLSLERLAWIGDALRAVASPLPPGAQAGLLFGLSNRHWQGSTLPIALDRLGAPGCALLVSPDDIVATTAAQGAASWSAPVPQDPALAGLAIHLQALALDPTANALGIATSDGLEVRFGIR